MVFVSFLSQSFRMNGLSSCVLFVCFYIFSPICELGVGKTCLLLRYANESFSPTFITTIGIDFKIKNIILDGKRIKLQIWDTAGQERFRTITTSYFRGAQGILLVYDVTERQTFLSIRNWVQQIQMHADVNVNKILIGNKADLKENRVVSTEEGEALAKEFNIKFFETSARQDLNVDTAFEKIATDVKDRLMESDGNGSAPAGRKLTANTSGGKNRNCC